VTVSNIIVKTCFMGSALEGKVTKKERGIKAGQAPHRGACPGNEKGSKV
jgi:hypothetical protein